MSSNRNFAKVLRSVFLLAAVVWFSAGSAQQPLTLDDAVRKVTSETDGRVLIAERIDENGRVRFKIKLLTENGTVKVIFVDPETGRIEN